jgi:glycosyltransferase involved in cell wall biosynthesis
MTGETRPRISVLLITLDAERMLEDVLESVAWADEIVIVDSGSTDRTAEIARRFTPAFHTFPYEGHGAQRQRTLELSSGDWILYVDADEVVTPELRASIEQAVREPGECVAYRMELYTWFFGRWFGPGSWRKEWKVRLFRRDRGRFDSRPIHEGAHIDGPIGNLTGPLLHYPYRDIAHVVEKANLYSGAMADDRYDAGKRSSAGVAVLRAFGRFTRDYVFGGEFLKGSAGLVRSTLNGYYTFLKYAKLWERSEDARGGERRPQAVRGRARSRPAG